MLSPPFFVSNFSNFSISSWFEGRIIVCFFHPIHLLFALFAFSSLFFDLLLWSDHASGLLWNSFFIFFFSFFFSFFFPFSGHECLYLFFFF